MAVLLSPGVSVTEVDASTIVPTLGSSVCVFAGNFKKGDVNAYNLITSVDELIQTHGLPDDDNYNDWYQVYNFLRYSNTILTSRAANINGKKTKTLAKLVKIGKENVVPGKVVDINSSLTVVGFETSIADDHGDTVSTVDYTQIRVTDTTEINVGDMLVFGDKTFTVTKLNDDNYITLDSEIAADTLVGVTIKKKLPDTSVVDHKFFEIDRPSLVKIGDIISFDDIDKRYCIKAIDGNLIELDHALPEDPADEFRPLVNAVINTVEIAFNCSNEAVDATQVTETKFKDTYVNIPRSIAPIDLFNTNKQFLNKDDFDLKIDSVAFSDPANSKIKFISRNPGKWANRYRISILNPSAFEANDDSDSHLYRYVAEGIAVDDLFEYAPQDTQIGVVIYDELNEEVVEVYAVDLVRGKKDANGKSTFIENVINEQSSVVFVKCNDNCKNSVADYCLYYDSDKDEYIGTQLMLVNGGDSNIQDDDLLSAYEVFSNKEELDIDVVIGNELDGGKSAKDLVTTRKDCIAFIGAPYELLIGKKATVCVQNLVNWRKRGAINYDNKYVVACGNYKYMYDRYNDCNRWVNIAGDIAGLRCQTNSDYATWYASAGLERGQIVDVIKLAFNPTKAHRDMMYKNSINPIVTFPGQGTVMWGQKNLQSKASSFDRVNVVGLFNTMERALEKMSRYAIMELNDTYTRSRIKTMIDSYLSGLGRGIQDYMVVCDSTNNTPDSISRNELHVDIYVKPTYVAEFIHLNFINAGTNDFSSVIQTA